MDMVEQEYHMNKDMVGLDKWGGLAAGARVSCAMRCKLRDLFRSRRAEGGNRGSLGIMVIYRHPETSWNIDETETSWKLYGAILVGCKFILNDWNF